MTLGFFLFVDDPFGGLENLIINGGHDGQRNVKRSQCGVDLVTEFLTHLTLIIFFKSGRIMRRRFGHQQFDPIGCCCCCCWTSSHGLMLVTDVVVVDGKSWRRWSVFVAQNEQRRKRNASG